MKILVLNCGSSSLKYQLINSSDWNLLAKGLIEKIGASDSIATYKAGENTVRETLGISNHDEALRIALKMLMDERTGVVSNIGEIEAVGHRVVHGAERFSGSVLLTDEVMNTLKECSIFAPLHNPPNIMGIEACKEIMKDVKQVGIFDTAFHQKIPQHAYLYGLPYEYYEKHRIRRYGFHGTSHWYVSKKAAEILGKDYSASKIITCHLGNGASITAVKNGQSVDTSMGFTPLEGLLMGTRAGDIDPAIITYIMQKENISPKEMDKILNSSSGLKGITKGTNDMREIEDAMETSPIHKLAFDIFCYRVKKYVGSYLAVLGGADALVFTAGIGENSPLVRSKVCEEMSYAGIEIDEEKNNTRGEIIISKGRLPVMVVPTNEELAIAIETKRVIEEMG